MAERIAGTVSDHYERLSSSLDATERAWVRQIATSNGIDERNAGIEYLSNACLFQAMRSYFDLPNQDRMPWTDFGGFLAFTWNGSIIASPPAWGEGRRTFHYTRMPSRTADLDTSSRDGALLRDPEVGHRLVTSVFTSSAVRKLLYVPAARAQMFSEIHNSMVLGSATISRIVTRKP
jgi:hypothetical protein